MTITDISLQLGPISTQAQQRLLGEHLAHWAETTPGAPALTFLDHAEDPAGVAHRFTFAELDAAVTAAAVRLQAETAAGDRIAIMTPQSAEYVVFFVAALRAGRVAVPLFSPDLPGHGERLGATFADCEPTLVLASTRNADVVRDFLREQPGGASTRLLVVDDGATVDAPLQPHGAELDDLAYLQYTSGSTRSPAGVLISHRNLVVNAAQGLAALVPDADATFVSWLPLFHDMGLVAVIGGGLVGGRHAVLMDPLAFLVDPSRWIHALAAHPHATAMAPNFAFDYAASRLSEEQKEGLDLSGVAHLGNGSEPVRPQTLVAFQEAFGPHGLRPHTVRPIYGLAEATVYVSGRTAVDAGGGNRPVVEADFDLEQLSLGRATTDVTPGAATMTMVSVDTPLDQVVAIADPATERRVEDGTVAEIWVHGPNVSAGYWRSRRRTEESFGRTLGDPGDLPSGPWLRTGDLGVVHDGSLYVTGRLKDLVIVGGRNHYPQDLEATVEGSHRAVGRHRSAAFAVDTPQGEAVVVVAEISRRAETGSWTIEEVTSAVSTALSSRHSVKAHEIVLVTPHAVPRTSSGKIARSATRDRWLAGELDRADDGTGAGADDGTGDTTGGSRS